jgi:hypothetical protein
MRSQVRRTFGHVTWAGILLLSSWTIAPSTAASPAGAATTRRGTDAVGSASIMGTAWKADNTPIPQAKVRLRNVASGKTVAAAIANDAGQFTFGDIEPGPYIVELISDNGRILAVSHTLAVGQGETIATFVRLGSKVPWFGGFFVNAAASVTAAAASTGVTAVAPEEMRPVSPQK